MKFRMFMTAAMAAGLLSGPLTVVSMAQAVVSLGGGSVSAAPPTYKAKSDDRPNEGYNATKMLTRKIYADEMPARISEGLEIPGRPLPTNDWWTDIINNRYSGSLWSYPAMLRTSANGLEVNYPGYWADAGKEIKSRSALTIGGVKYQADATIAADWHDWDVVFRMPAVKDGDAEMKVTAVHGSPFTWAEFSEMTPQVSFSAAPSQFGNAKGCLGIKIGDDLYGLYFPEQTVLEWKEGTLRLNNCAWLAVALLRSEADLTGFSRYAASVPRDTRVEWRYDEANSRISTHWSVKAENLRKPGDAAPVMQGFLPHAYKYALPGATLNFLSDGGFLTPRGQMKLATSDSGVFGYSYQFSGMMPYYAAPEQGNAAQNGYSQAIMNELMESYAASGSFGADTYWGGKGLTQMALNMTFAKQTGNDALYEKSKKRLREVFENWLTYTPGEDSFFFSYYPRWGAMLGFNVSYDSDAFNDHHFHYGYFTYAAALLCMEDKDFASKYGEVLTMIAKDYANWDRTDNRFPFMRTLDPWCGHSWAGGLGDAGNDNGNGQESTSESMQGWGGIYLLGVALDNKEMRDAGLFGWNTEARATREYWYDVDAPRPANEGGRQPWPGKNERQGNYDYTQYPYAYNSNITGKGIGWWTWFGGDPLYMHGIQWMPISPALDYLSWDKDFVAWAYEDMMSGANSTFSHKWFEATENSANGERIEPLAANDWGSVTLSYLQRSNPSLAAQIFDEAWQKGMHIAKSVSTSHISYYITHNHLTYGDPDFSIHADIPTAQVCVKDGKQTFMVYNPGDADRTVNFYTSEGAKVKSIIAPPGRLTAYSADAVATSIEAKIEDGEIIPPGMSAAISSRVLDQYGAGVPDAKIEMAVQPGAPARIENGKINVAASAAKGTEFDVTLTSGGLSETIRITVNDRPVVKSAVVEGLNPMAEIGSTLNMQLLTTDQYGVQKEHSDAVWRYETTDSKSGVAASEYKPTKAGVYTFTGSTADGKGSASAQCFVTPPMPLVSGKAKVVASSAENAGSLPENINDGDGNSRWGSAHTSDEWVYLDLGADCYISRVALLWEAAYASKYNVEVAPSGCRMITYEANIAGKKSTVNVPADETWTTVVAETASKAGLKETAINATGRYVRIKGIERGTNYGYSIYEMSVYGLDSSIGSDDVIGVDFELPQAIDQHSEVELKPLAFTRSGEIRPTDVTWSADKEAVFNGNRFVPKSYGNYVVTAKTSSGATSAASVFVNEVERLASISLPASEYETIIGYGVKIEPTAMNQFGAPYSAPAGDVAVSITPAEGAAFDKETNIFTANARGEYTIDFNGMAQAKVKVIPLNEANLALGKYASASSDKGGNSAGNVTDGDESTRWESAWEDGQTLTVDLEEAYEIDRAEILWEGAYAKAYRFEVSMDGENWYEAYSESVGKGGLENISFQIIPARYVRLCCDVRAMPDYGFSIKELRVFGQRRMADDVHHAAPDFSSVDYVLGNGQLTAAAEATHPSGYVFVEMMLEDASGRTVGVQRAACHSGDALRMEFKDLMTGEYTLRVSASDAYGNTTEKIVGLISVIYSLDGINVALGKNAWSSSQENGGLSASNVTDGNYDTRWGSTFNDDEWVVIDLGALYTLTEIRLFWNRPAFATEYSVQLAEDDTEDAYETIVRRTEFTPATRAVDADDIVKVDGVQARYIRIIGHKRATPYGTSLNEVEAYASGVLSAVSAMEAEASAATEWYTLTGMRIARPTEPGIYIRRQGTRTSKTIIR